MKKVTKEESQAMMNEPPDGWIIWGNHGDGLWRAGPPQENMIKPAPSVAEALRLAWDVWAGLIVPHKD